MNAYPATKTLSEEIEHPASEAGRCGPDVRSDLRVRIERREHGGIEIDLHSRVEPYYGESIRRLADTVLEELGIRHARVHIEDEGALPFVISARLEAAVRRAGLGKGTRVLPEQVKLPEASTRDRMRSTTPWHLYPHLAISRGPKSSSAPADRRSAW